MPFPTLVTAPLLALGALLPAPPAQPAPPTAGSVAVAWPVPHPVVLAPYSAPADPFAPGHRGVDLAAFPGEPVAAALAGTVAFSGTVAGTPVVTLDHGAGLRTTYQPVDAALAAGTRVRPGQVIGNLASGAGHCGQVPACLHWGARRGGSYLDPLALLPGSHPVLLPLDPAATRASGPSGSSWSSDRTEVSAVARRRPATPGEARGNVVATGGGALVLLGATGAAAALGRRRLRGEPRGIP